MLGKSYARKLLLAQPFAGRVALLWGLIAVMAPTAVRQSVDGVVTGLAITPYLPFVLISAVVLEWRQAALVATASVVVADTLFVGTPGHFLEGPADMLAVSLFAIIAAMFIGFVQLVRGVVAEMRKPARAQQLSSGIIFSLEQGEAWASWYGTGSTVCLGPRDEVAEMMQDFLAQVELGKRLTREPVSL